MFDLNNMNIYDKCWGSNVTALGDDAEMGIPKCVWGEPIVKLMNNATVRAALNVDPANTDPFTLCVTDSFKEYAYHKDARGSQYVYEDLMNDTSVKMLHYSGDQDGNVPTIGT